MQMECKNQEEKMNEERSDLKVLKMTIAGVEISNQNVCFQC